MPVEKLTLKQQKFIEAFEGNATEAARKAGYTGSDETLSQTGFKLMKHKKVRAAIQDRQTAQIQKLIADRNERDQMLTLIMRDARRDDWVRLKACEMLAKANGDYIHTTGSEKMDGLAARLAAARKRVTEINDEKNRADMLIEVTAERVETVTKEEAKARNDAVHMAQIEERIAAGKINLK